MKVNLARSAGFCFGVKRAINMALETASSCKNVFMLGDIVHNEDVIKQITRAGITKIDKLGPGKGKTLLLRAHGASRAFIEKVKKCGYRIIDATCPMVKEIHKIAIGMEKKGRKIIIIGDKNHDEVRGIIGQLKGKALVIDSERGIPFPALKKIKKACVVTQSTQNIEKVMAILEILKKHIPHVDFFNTICGPTRIKQKEVREMPVNNGVMIVIGSRNSANTKRLYEISRSINKDTYWVNSTLDIKKAWFKKRGDIGVTAGASTPEQTIKKIVGYLKSI